MNKVLFFVIFGLCNSFLYSMETALLKEFTGFPELNFLHKVQRLTKQDNTDKIVLYQLYSNAVLENIRPITCRKALKRRMLIDIKTGVKTLDLTDRVIEHFAKRNDCEMVMLALRYGFRLQNDILPFDVENPDMKNLLLLSLKYQDPVLLKWMVNEDKKRREELAWMKNEFLRRWRSSFYISFLASQLKSFEKKNSRVPIGVTKCKIIR